eukprot:TRINITY_DN10791_c0_g1_i1.p1 TRINITY_DN10791_c0_g1~~TRINITY_DN10791_c0_g1_i1.p1  ORF type:complete len:172 (-),score=35.15 TRINITY_DN10791_c0_g1_i1:93-608(-)
MAHSPLGRTASHRKLMLRNMATSLILHTRIETTLTKAKRLQPLAETLVTKAKVNSLHNRRIVGEDIKDQSALNRLFYVLGPAFQDRPGGYTRIVKTDFRKGDNAPMATIEYLKESVKEYTTQKGQEAKDLKKQKKREAAAAKAASKEAAATTTTTTSSESTTTNAEQTPSA